MRLRTLVKLESAARLGLNRTDMRVLELLNRNGPMGASDLATATGLTGAAVTTVIDRLEGRDLVARRSDPNDRRRVLVDPTRSAAEVSHAVFGDLQAGILKLLTGYSEAELATISDFLNATREVFARQIEALHRNGPRTARPRLSDRTSPQPRA